MSGSSGDGTDTVSSLTVSVVSAELESLRGSWTLEGIATCQHLADLIFDGELPNLQGLTDANRELLARKMDEVLRLVASHVTGQAVRERELFAASSRNIGKQPRSWKAAAATELLQLNDDGIVDKLGPKVSGPQVWEDRLISCSSPLRRLDLRAGVWLNGASYKTVFKKRPLLFWALVESIIDYLEDGTIRDELRNFVAELRLDQEEMVSSGARPQAEPTVPVDSFKSAGKSGTRADSDTSRFSGTNARPVAAGSAPAANIDKKKALRRRIGRSLLVGLRAALAVAILYFAVVVSPIVADFQASELVRSPLTLSLVVAVCFALVAVLGFYLRFGDVNLVSCKAAPSFRVEYRRQARLISKRRRWFERGVAVLPCVLAMLFAFVTWIAYANEMWNAGSILDEVGGWPTSPDKLTGDNLFNSGHVCSVPAVTEGPPVGADSWPEAAAWKYSPVLDTCQVRDGVLHLEHSQPRLDSTKITEYPENAGLMGSSYYVETRIHAEGSAPISACNLELGVVKDGLNYQPLLMRLLPIGAGMFGAEVSQGAMWRYSIVSPDLPFVGKRSLDHPDGDEWTKLAVYVKQRQFTFLIDDRIVGAVEISKTAFDGFESRATVAVQTQTDGVTNRASCAFQYLKVRSSLA